MSYSELPTISVGDAVKKESYDGIRTNQIDHESRISSLEGSASKIVVFDSTIYNASTASSMMPCTSCANSKLAEFGTGTGNLGYTSPGYLAYAPGRQSSSR